MWSCVTWMERWGGGRVGREEEGDQASFCSFLISLFSVFQQGDMQRGAGVPSALLSFVECLHWFGSQQPHFAHLSPTRFGCEGKRRVRGGKYGGVNRTWVDAHLLVRARTAHRQALAGGGVNLVLGRAPLLDLRCLAPDADAHRVRVRGLKMKSRVSDRVGQDVQSRNAPPSRSTDRTSAGPCRWWRQSGTWTSAIA